MGINALLDIIKKNLILFWRSKISAISIILAPVLIILLATYAFNSSALSGIVIAVNSDSYTSLTEEILFDFEEQDYTINRFDSSEDCINSVKLSSSQICVIFPEDLSTTGSVNDVVFYVDYSRINLAYTLINEIESKINLKASDLGQIMAQNLINTLQSSNEILSDQTSLVSESLSSSNQIVKYADTNLNEDLNEVLDNLEKAKDLCDKIEGASSIKDEIEDSISVLESSLETSSNLGSIKNTSEQIKSNLNVVSSNLDQIITSINSVNILEAKKIVSPITTKIESINSNNNNKDYLIPIMLSLIALFGGILLGAIHILREKKTKAYFRNFITPTGDFLFILGSYITCLIILFVQFLLVFSGIHFLTDMPIFNVVGHLSLVLFLSLTAFIFIGILIGYLFRSDESIILASVLIASIFMFCSNTILPLESISGFLRNIVGFNPFVVSGGAFKKIILFNLGIGDVTSEIIILSIFSVVLLLLAFLGRKITKRKL